MIEPAELTGPGESNPEELASALRNELLLTGRIPNLTDKIGHLEELLERQQTAYARHPRNSALLQLQHDISDKLFDLKVGLRTFEHIEERLGRGDAEPVDLTLQQTLDVVQQLRQLAEIIPSDERLSTIATNVCEGLESFVTAALAGPQSPEEGENPSADVGASPADFTMALEVIETIRGCPGGDRALISKTLRQQFIDAACRSAWGRVDRLFDPAVSRATRKQYLHEALTIWSLMPELGENAGSPRLSQLPEDLRRTVQEVLLHRVIGSTQVGDPQGLLETALLAKELVEDYLTMIPAISLSEAQAEMGLQTRRTLVPRVRAELSSVDSWQDLETCLSVLSVLHTIPGAQGDEQLRKLSRPVRLARWRLRYLGALRFLRRMALPLSAALVGIGGLLGAYVGVAGLLENFYDITLPLTP